MTYPINPQTNGLGTKQYEFDITLRADFADDKYWALLAQKYCQRMPNYGSCPTESSMLKWIRRLRITLPEYLDATGYDNLHDFTRLNPDWPLRAFVGLLFEYRFEIDQAKGILRAYSRNMNIAQEASIRTDLPA